ncbi:SGNH/GDSL hydrolase family protein [Sphingomonas sp. M1-B02]|uniref:SGNH/GDSL hydrolase family protein n=1 Tax=Sphingomonas sp. M1-B02 TaxID=3114300 RepID=UPI00223EE5CC|nr:SGNH/GDSL hydrolase family protein [Sphingomonas sp. S6-11]UZK65761.1 SGNH/GDSL hydrolase family protein [Sphingomonas sp. S6-11]
MTLSHRVARWLLLFGALIALGSPATAQNPPGFADEIRAFAEADALQMPAKGGILFVGSSSIRMWEGLAQDFPGLPVLNRGFGGSTIAESIHYADRIILPYAPRTIVFYAGDNDIAGGRSAEQVLGDFQTLVGFVHAWLPRTRILYIAIKPSIARWSMVGEIRKANALIEAYTRTSDRLGFIDIFPAMLGADGKPRADLLREDGLHMTRAGYVIWRDAVRRALGER